VQTTVPVKGGQPCSADLVGRLLEAGLDLVRMPTEDRHQERRSAGNVWCGHARALCGEDEDGTGGAVDEEAGLAARSPHKDVPARRERKIGAEGTVAARRGQVDSPPSKVGEVGWRVNTGPGSAKRSGVGRAGGGGGDSRSVGGRPGGGDANDRRCVAEGRVSIPVVVEVGGFVPCGDDDRDTLTPG